MATKQNFQVLILTLLFFCCLPWVSLAAKYDVQSFGAEADGKSDCTKAFLSAWGAACATTTPATIYVPAGRYLLSNANFGGQLCKNNEITIQIDGTLVAPSDYNVVGKNGKWLQFERVTGVSIIGGTLDGQGVALWDCKNSGKSCPEGATVRFVIACKINVYIYYVS